MPVPLDWATFLAGAYAHEVVLSAGVPDRRAYRHRSRPSRCAYGARGACRPARANRGVDAGASYAELRAGRMPIVLGGDHCLGIGSITAVARYCREQGQLRVLWLDAHSDLPVACLCGLGPQALTELGGSAPALRPECAQHRVDVYDMRWA
ncbi:arginase family protein [Pantoea ananatis]|uniref:arginase family protein n=1 Tax=Pantoea ananas TaxID=553 RepID=UPI00221FA302|nr:arginase family protein [Pantoea ananatis]